MPDITPETKKVTDEEQTEVQPIHDNNMDTLKRNRFFSHSVKPTMDRQERIAVMRKSVCRNKDNYRRQGFKTNVLDSPFGLNKTMPQQHPATLDVDSRPSVFGLAKEKAEDLTSQVALGHYQANNDLIDDFLVIGIDTTDIKNYEIELEKDTSWVSSVESPDEVGFQARILHMHSQDENCQRRKVVKDFCFPSEVHE
mmetsp:Transcript_29769/g.45380  ORF Transcript_29769/g.45380 Transcript_29769/m.45380 type:complete len:197 (-) Transcript_29769:1586-2176(-)